MKKCFFAIAAVVLCGCSKGMIQSSGEREESIELTFSVPVAGTKVSGTTIEDAVESLQIFVFGEDGQIQASGTSDQNSLTLTCTTGDKMIAAFVNAPAVSSVRNLDDIYALQSSFYENSLGRFVMSGIEEKSLNAAGEVKISVSRLVSKVCLKSIANAFELLQHQQMDFSLQSVFITNAPVEASYLGTTAHDNWIGIGDGELLYDTLEETLIPYGETAAYDNYLYCYPNTYDSDDNRTYLVVKAALGGGVYYYSAPLPKMESNKCYNVSMTVTRPGSLSPDTPVKKEDIEFSVTVADWAGNVEVDEII